MFLLSSTPSILVVVTCVVWFMATTKWTLLVAARTATPQPVSPGTLQHPVVVMKSIVVRHNDDDDDDDDDTTLDHDNAGCPNLGVTTATTTTWWEDEENDDDIKMNHKCARKRLLLPIKMIHQWWRPWTTTTTTPLATRRQSPSPRTPNKNNIFQPLPQHHATLSMERPLPHALRTDRYEIRVQWRPRNHHKRRRWTSRRAAIQDPDTTDPSWDNNVTTTTTTTIVDTFTLEFDPNGYVRLLLRLGDDTTKQPPEYIGTWKLQPNGLVVHLPLPQPLLPSHRDGPRSSIILTADFHANPFGSQPKLTRGVVRTAVGGPILGTCTGIGIGIDTMDLSYQQRTPVQ